MCIPCIGVGLWVHCPCQGNFSLVISPKHVKECCYRRQRTGQVYIPYQGQVQTGYVAPPPVQNGYYPPGLGVLIFKCKNILKHSTIKLRKQAVQAPPPPAQYNNAPPPPPQYQTSAPPSARVSAVHESLVFCIAKFYRKLRRGTLQTAPPPYPQYQNQAYPPVQQ